MQIEAIPLPADKVGQWTDTKALFYMACPGFNYLFTSLLHNHNGEHVALFTRSIPIAATDGRNIMLNPDTFFKLGHAERLFVLTHEVMHCVYKDSWRCEPLRRANEVRYDDGKVIPYDAKMMNIAEDYRINAMLVDSRIGKMPANGCLDDRFKGDHAANDIYRTIYEDEESKSGGPGLPHTCLSGDPSKGGFDIRMEPGASQGKDPYDPDMKPDEQKWANAMATAQHLEMLKTQGNLSAHMKRLFDMYLKPQVSWVEHIRGLFARRLGSGSSDWRRPDRRLIVRDIYAPGRSGHGVGWVCVWGDTSGSISREELNTYFAELGGLIDELNPKRVTVFWHDAGKVREDRTDEITGAGNLEDIRARGVGGGGGTDCRPVFQFIDDNYDKPDAFVGLTDGHTPFPDHEPSYDCVWACTTDVKIPFGDVVRIKPNKQEN